MHKNKNKFWEYHDIIFDNWEGENTGWITENALDGFARDSKLDRSEFNSCMNNSEYKEKVSGK